MDARWQQALTTYLQELSGSPNTLSNYRTTLKLWLADRNDPGAATTLDVQAFIGQPSKWGGAPSPQTVHSRLSPLRGLYSRAVEWGLIQRDPTLGIRRPKIPPPLPRGLTIPQVREFFAAVFVAQKGRRLGLERALRNRAAFAVAIFTGLRLHEITTLTAEHLLSAYAADDGGLYVVVRTKGNIRRKVFFQPPVLAALRDYIAATDRVLETMERAERIFLKLSDDALRKAVRETAAAAGLGDLTTHALRHTAAKLRRAVGDELETVQSFLGHASPSTTDRYLKRLDPERDDRWQDVAKLVGF